MSLLIAGAGAAGRTQPTSGPTVPIVPTATSPDSNRRREPDAGRGLGTR